MAGVGKVGHHLVGHLVEEGATVVVTDVSADALDRVRAEHPAVRTVATTEALLAERLDVYAPCAMGGALTDDVVETLAAAAPRSSAAPPTTSSRTPGSRRRWPSAASSTRPTTA